MLSVGNGPVIRRRRAERRNFVIRSVHSKFEVSSISVTVRLSSSTVGPSLAPRKPLQRAGQFYFPSPQWP